MASTIKSNAVKLLKGIIVCAICLVIWEILAISVDDSYFLPHVQETFVSLFMLIGKKGFLKTVATSLIRVLAGLVIGIISGVLLATVSHILPLANTFISTVISIMKATPVAAIILILWFTFTDAALAVFVVILMVTPVVWQNVYDGYRSISKDMLEVCEIFEFDFKKKLRILIIPTVIKYLIPAVITSIGLAWKAEIAAEIMTYSNIGRSIQDFKTLHYDTSSVFAWAIVIIAFSIILEQLTK